MQLFAGIRGCKVGKIGIESLKVIRRADIVNRGRMKAIKRKAL
jgi:hypothetical protein